MARAPDHSTSASLGHKTMTRTIYCPQCGVVLNVPESAAGRKLRCPKCATKFAAPAAVGPADSVIAESGPGSTMFPTHHKGPASSGDFRPPTRRGSSGSVELPSSTPSSGDFDLPTSPAPLRETFDLPLLGEDLPKAAPSKTKAPPSAAADALALFQDEPKANRKLTGAEARARARRCPTCGGVVAVGMSLCNTCGLDLDTGQRIAPLDVFEDEMPVAPRADTPSMGVMFVGGVCIIANLLLTVASLIAWSKGNGSGVLMLLVVWLFGIYASVQFVRRKAIRPLFLALGLGVGIGVVYLIALPIWEANIGTDVIVTNSDGVASSSTDPNDPDAPPVRPLEIDMNRITWGIALLLSYAALSVYLNSPAMKREFNKK